MAQQQIVDINQFLASMLITGQLGDKWRKCQRKQYNVFAIVPPAGYVFSNKLEQPDEYAHIKKRFGKVIVHANLITDADLHVLKKNCYITDGKTVVICGTRGELWTTSPANFIESYTKIDGTKITKVPTDWVEVSRAAESAPSGYGLQIPIHVLGNYTGKYGIRQMNNPNSSGHYKGDILVVSNDYQKVSTINNEVFALTFNQNVGGWAQSGCIASPDSIKQLTLSDIKKYLTFDGVPIESIRAALPKEQPKPASSSKTLVATAISTRLSPQFALVIHIFQEPNGALSNVAAKVSKEKAESIAAEQGNHAMFSIDEFRFTKHTDKTLEDKQFLINVLRQLQAAFNSQQIDGIQRYVSLSNKALRLIASNQIKPKMLSAAVMQNFR